MSFWWKEKEKNKIKLVQDKVVENNPKEKKKRAKIPVSKLKSKQKRAFKMARIKKEMVKK